VVLVGLAGSIASAQQATTVQLPTYSYFTTRTTVSVPDRGSVYLGGVKRAATGRNEFGAPLMPFGNRSIGAERSASSARVSVTIHDFEAMDEYLLSQPVSRASQPAVARRPAGHAAARPPRPELPASAGAIWGERSQAAAERSTGPMAKSLAELRAEHRREQQARQEEAAGWLERGRNAETAGKANVARVYYQRAVRRATGQLKAEVAARLAAVSEPPAAPRVAQSRPQRKTSP
jgi:hypothetical protein